MTDKKKPIANISEPFAPLQDLVRRSSGSNRSQLWQAWHFLQVYASWGARLPTATSDFSAIMGGSPAEFGFFEPMQDGNKLIVKACSHFLEEVFTDVVGVGMDLKIYAKLVANDGIVKFILQMVEKGNTKGALKMLGTLGSKAEKARIKAEKVTDGLAAFKSDLNKAVGKLDTAQKSLDEDSRTNKDTLDKLAGPEDQEGSLKYFHKQVAENRRLHTEATIAAATSPTYMFLVPPVGLIATGVVMGIYTDKAIKRWKDIEEFQDLIDTKGLEQQQAIAARNIFTQADTGLANVIEYTNTALAKSNVVQDSWKSIAAHIAEIEDWVGTTVSKSADGQLELSSKEMLGFTLGLIEEQWAELRPDLEELMTDNYVTITPGVANVEDVTAAIEPA